MKQRFGKKVRPESLRRTVRKLGYNNSVPRKKPFFSNVNRERRVKFVKKQKEKQVLLLSVNSIYLDAMIKEKLGEAGNDLKPRYLLTKGSRG